MITNCELTKQINNNTYIDYVNIEPNYILFGSTFSYFNENEVMINVSQSKNNKIFINTLKDVHKIFNHISLKNENINVLFIEFSNCISTPDICQVIENISKYLYKIL